MALNLNLANFASRNVRKAIGNNGIRRFATNALEQKANDQTNIITKAWNGLSHFGGFLLSKVGWQPPWVKFTLSTLWGWFTGGVQFVWNFNWNASDKELDQSVTSAFNALGGTLGGTIGSALGYLACGAVPGAVIFAFNEPMGAYVLKELGEEALDEMAGNVANLIRQTGNLLMRSVAVSIYKNVRSLLRKPDSKVRQQLMSQGKLSPEQINKAIAARNKPWSFAIAFDDFVERIPNAFLRNFVEELVEEFADSCVEAGYVVANAMDSYLATQKLANDGFFGKEKTVEIILNRDADRSATTP